MKGKRTIAPTPVPPELAALIPELKEQFRAHTTPQTRQRAMELYLAFCHAGQQKLYSAIHLEALAEQQKEEHAKKTQNQELP